MILTIKPVLPCTATSSAWTVEFRRSKMGLLMTIQVILAFGLIIAIRMETVKVIRSDDVLGTREMVACKGRCEDDDKSRAVNILIRIVSLH